MVYVEPAELVVVKITPTTPPLAAEVALAEFDIPPETPVPTTTVAVPEDTVAVTVVAADAELEPVAAGAIGQLGTLGRRHQCTYMRRSPCRKPGLQIDRCWDKTRWCNP